MSLVKRTLGSLLSVTAGWAVCSLVWAAVGAALALGEGVDTPFGAVQAAVFFALYAAVFCGAFALVTWLAVFVWIYLFLPPSSGLWVWWRAALFGAAVGVVIVAVVSMFLPDANWRPLIAYAPSGALTGATTAVFAALTRPFFFKQ